MRKQAMIAKWLKTIARWFLPKGRPANVEIPKVRDAQVDNDELAHHLYMAIWTDMTRSEIADLFAQQGWLSRKCSWTDYEVELSDIAELVIESEKPTLIHGPLSNSSELVLVIRQILDDADLVYTFEAYDEGDRIVSSLTEQQLKARGWKFAPDTNESGG